MTARKVWAVLLALSAACSGGTEPAPAFLKGRWEGFNGRFLRLEILVEDRSVASTLTMMSITAEFQVDGIDGEPCDSVTATTEVRPDSTFILNSDPDTVGCGFFGRRNADNTVIGNLYTQTVDYGQFTLRR